MRNAFIIILLALSGCVASFFEERFDKKCISSMPTKECEEEFVIKKGQMHFGPEPDVKPIFPVEPVEPSRGPLKEVIPRDWFWNRK